MMGTSSSGRPLSVIPPKRKNKSLGTFLPWAKFLTRDEKIGDDES
jgi:hypothetical protein